MESSEMAEAEARMAVGDDPQEQDGRDREGTQCVVDLELLGGGGGENQGLEKAGELGSLGGSKAVDLDDGGAKAISYSTMISKLQAVVQSDCQFGYVFAEPQGARPWFRPGCLSPPPPGAHDGWTLRPSQSAPVLIGLPCHRPGRTIEASAKLSGTEGTVASRLIRRHIRYIRWTRQLCTCTILMEFNTKQEQVVPRRRSQTQLILRAKVASPFQCATEAVIEGFGCLRHL
ncbi:hypothetical protein DTO063F5_1237 [Paecilomyces variotii]|nr:hypothetical protein DTO063F5_1237 [Paecilomyces variotii]